MKKLEYDSLTIYVVEYLCKILLDMKEDESVELDLQDVQRIDMPVIQLFISTQKRCKENSVDFSLHNLSSEILDTLKLCGFETLFGVAND